MSSLMVNDDEEYSSSIVLHEDKKYYPDADELYGDAEVLVMEEDDQPIEKPIVEPIKVKCFSELEKSIPNTTVGEMIISFCKVT